MAGLNLSYFSFVSTKIQYRIDETFFAVRCRRPVITKISSLHFPWPDDPVLLSQETRVLEMYS